MSTEEMTDLEKLAEFLATGAAGEVKVVAQDPGWPASRYQRGESPRLFSINSPKPDLTWEEACNYLRKIS